MSTTTKWLAGTNAVLGLWLIAAPFVLGVSGAGLWNAVIVGVIVASFGGYNGTSRPVRNRVGPNLPETLDQR